MKSRLIFMWAVLGIATLVVALIFKPGTAQEPRPALATEQAPRPATRQSSFDSAVLALRSLIEHPKFQDEVTSDDRRLQESAINSLKDRIVALYRASQPLPEDRRVAQFAIDDDDLEKFQTIFNSYRDAANDDARRAALKGIVTTIDSLQDVYGNYKPQDGGGAPAHAPPAEAYRARTPESDFLAAIRALNEVIKNPSLDKALEGNNELTTTEAVNELAAKIELLIAAGKNYVQAERALGRDPKSRFVIQDVDADDIRQVFDLYRRKETDLENVKKLVREFREIYARHWPNDTGVANAPQAAMIAHPPTQASTVQVAEETQLPDGRRVMTTREAPGYADPRWPAYQPTNPVPYPVAPPRRVPLAFVPEVTKAVERLRDAKDDTEKDAARTQLAEVLFRIFDDDMKRREQEVNQIEERVKNLRGQLDRRRDKRTEIVGVQLKVMENEAEGLGFMMQPAGPSSMQPWEVPATPGVNPPAAGTMTRPAGAPLREPYQQTAPAPRAATTRRPVQELARINATKAEVGMLRQQIEKYNADTRRLPTKLQDLMTNPLEGALASRWAGPYFLGVMPRRDGWNNEYQYAAPGKHNPESFDVWSMGPDGKDGTADDNGNWELPSSERFK